jgi:hypothetical protein
MHRQLRGAIDVDGGGGSRASFIEVTVIRGDILLVEPITQAPEDVRPGGG